MPYKIFICYRRENKELARGIELQLTEEFGADSVFLDVESIYGGQDWRKSISKALTGKPVVITLITTKWNSRRGGQLKLMDTDDHVRYELETALERGLHIVPVVYERAYFPKAKQLPSSLQPLLVFQKISMRNESMKNDSERLVAALKSLNVKPIKKPATATAATISPGTQNPPPTSYFTKSMFTLSPAQKKEFAERQKREEERLDLIRLEALPFYSRTVFWVAVVVTLALSFSSVYGAEVLTNLIGEQIDIDLPKANLTAGILLASLWSLVWLAIGAAAYNYDPARGPKVFYTRGILGGWVLGYDDWEPIGYWAAFPIATSVLWLVARGLSMLAVHYLQWDYLLIFWIVLAAYTLPVLVLYGLTASDEVL